MRYQHTQSGRVLVFAKEPGLPPNGPRMQCHNGPLHPLRDREGGLYLVKAIRHDCSSNSKQCEPSWTTGRYPASISHGGEAAWWGPVLHHWHVLHRLQAQPREALRNIQDR